LTKKYPHPTTTATFLSQKKFFFTHIEPDKKKSKRNVFVLTEVPKRQLLLQENKTKNQKEILAKKKSQ